MSRGHARERLVREMLEVGLGPDATGRGLFAPASTTRPWLVIRAAGSLGDVDVVALRALYFEPPCGLEALLIEVKSTAGGPYERFGPSDRAELLEAAELAGAEAWLAWIPPTPPGMKGVHGCWIPSAEWPA